MRTRDSRLLRQLKYLMGKLLSQTEERPAPRCEGAACVWGGERQGGRRGGSLAPPKKENEKIAKSCAKHNRPTNNQCNNVQQPDSLPRSDPFGLGADVVSTDANLEDHQLDHELAEAVGR